MKGLSISFSSARKNVGKAYCFLAHQNAEQNEASRPWTVNFSWNLTLEVFDCFKVVVVAPVAGGLVVRNTRVLSTKYTS